METFSKKEKEKARQKKRKEKEEKREERKANAIKGLSLDDMMAYIDENGNLSSTPPDPRKKKQFSQDDIDISGVRPEAAVHNDLVQEGVVTFFNTAKGYGFIKNMQTQESIFVHINAVKEPITESDKVLFSTEMTPKGPNAVNVRKVGA